jgi:hypothetical protein
MSFGDPALIVLSTYRAGLIISRLLPRMRFLGHFARRVIGSYHGKSTNPAASVASSESKSNEFEDGSEWLIR